MQKLKFMNKEVASNNEYLQWLTEIKSRILNAQQRAALKVNHELLNLYWFIGEALATKETEWGDKFINNLARDLKVEFPDTTGFSKRNLENLRRCISFIINILQFRNKLLRKFPME